MALTDIGPAGDEVVATPTAVLIRRSSRNVSVGWRVSMRSYCLWRQRY